MELGFLVRVDTYIRYNSLKNQYKSDKEIRKIYILLLFRPKMFHLFLQNSLFLLKFCIFKGKLMLFTLNYTVFVTVAGFTGIFAFDTGFCE